MEITAGSPSVTNYVTYNAIEKPTTSCTADWAKFSLDNGRIASHELVNQGWVNSWKL